MGKKGPCCHCGVGYTPVWRVGPPDKPVLCNACGKRWARNGNFENYFPQHAMNYSQSPSDLFSMPNPNYSTPIHRFRTPTQVFESNILEHTQPSSASKSIAVGHDGSPFSLSNIGGHGQDPFVFGAERRGIGTAVSGKRSCTQNEENANRALLWDSNNVSLKKRSIQEQQVLSLSERPHQQLYIATDVQPEIDEEEDPENVLIFERINKYIPENEIGLGCMLLKPPPSPTQNSEPEPRPESSVGTKAAAAPAPPKNTNRKFP